MEDILYNKLDPHFKDEIAEKIGLEEIKPCFTCGSCTGACPVREVIDDFDPRLIIHNILLGMRKEVLSSNLIWFYKSLFLKPFKIIYHTFRRKI